MQFHPNEIFLYFDPTTSTGKQTRAYATSIAGNINAIDWNKVKLTATLWKEIVNMLDLRPKDLLNRALPEYQNKVRGNTFTMNGWLEILANNPQLLKAPIVIYRNKAVLCNKPTDILKIDNSRREKKALPHLRSM
ncbi:MAG: glutaredoxin [Cyclobacteriaceae bacterium]|nr:glutaredoxin [Cyclobacteriaceae bacterium]